MQVSSNNVICFNKDSITLLTITASGLGACLIAKKFPRSHVRYFLSEFGIQLQLQKHTVFSRLNAGSVYLKLGLVYPAFIRTWRLFGARRLLKNAFFSVGSSLNQEPKFIKNI